MKTITFSDKELAFLKEQYTTELANAEQYVYQIKEVLRKIGGSAKADKEEPIEKEPKKGKRRGRKAKVKILEQKESKKRGRKPKAVPTEIVEPPKKRGRKPKAVPTPEKAESTASTPVVKKGTKKVNPKSKTKIVAKPKVAKKAAIKKTPKVAPSKEPVPTSEVKQAPKKEIKKIVKRKRI